MSYISAVTRDNKVIVWERNEDGERIIQTYDAPYYFYYDDPNGKYKTIFDTPVSKLTFSTSREYQAAKREFAGSELKTWESDIQADIRVLSNHYYGVPAPKLNITLLDIEVDYDPERGVTVQEMVATDPYAEINSVALIHQWKKEVVVLTVPPEPGWTAERLEAEVETCAPDAPIDKDLTIRYHVCESERELLLMLLIELEDSDVISGWNCSFFDFPYIAQRIVRVLDKDVITLATQEGFDNRGRVTQQYVDNPNPAISKAGKFKWLKKLDFPQHGGVTFRPVSNATTGKLMGNTIDLVGRVTLDYMNLVKKYEPGEKPSYKLAAISNEVLVDEKTKEPLLPKLEYEGNLADLYRNNYAFFTRYNIRDTEILYGFERKLGYIELANQIAHLSTAQFSHIGGTLKLAELALVNYCHHTLRRVVKNVTEPEIDRAIDGALVLLPQIGLHENVGSIDINSLYPSAIRSINISPETIRGQFVGTAKDAAEIAKGSQVICVMDVEGSDEKIEMTAEQWREWLIERQWAISGYGTVFDQTKRGFIPALLAEWYAMRKQYQKKKADAGAEADKLVADAKAAGVAVDAKEYSRLLELAGYYDRLQYVYKIKLNSLYGALTNLYFRFYDLRMGESTTGSGRVILKHQCRKTAETLEGDYDVDFPLYATVEDAIGAGYSESEAREVALHGPMFNGKYPSDAVVYGDTDSVDGSTLVDIDGDVKSIEEHFTSLTQEANVVRMRNDVELLMLDGMYEMPCPSITSEGWDYAPVNLLYRHKTSKRRYKITTSSGREVIVTEDHSLIKVEDNQLIACKPTEMKVGDRVIEQA